MSRTARLRVPTKREAIIKAEHLTAGDIVEDDGCVCVVTCATTDPGITRLGLLPIGIKRPSYAVHTKPLTFTTAFASSFRRRWVTDSNHV